MIRVPIKEVEMSSQERQFYDLLFRIAQVLERMDRKLDSIDRNTSVHQSPS